MHLKSAGKLSAMYILPAAGRAAPTVRVIEKTRMRWCRYARVSQRVTFKRQGVDQPDYFMKARHFLLKVAVRLARRKTSQTAWAAGPAILIPS